MKVFITHAFRGDGESFAATLKGDLRASGIKGYMAEKARRYDLMIHDKIRQEIEESEWLVAIITERSRMSASVHEEIDYALGKGVKEALMVEKGVKEGGVLIYGREQEVLVSQEFGANSNRVAESIRSAPRAAPRQDSIGEAARAFLEKRQLLSVELPDFARNAHFDGLYSGSISDDEKPVVLFTARHHDLVNHHNITSLEFREWVESNVSVEVDGRRIRILGDEPDIDIGTLRVDQKCSYASSKNIKMYREFKFSGFLEWGTSYLFFCPNDRGKVELHLCCLIGEFWAFLASARLFYKKIGLDAPFTVRPSIRNTHTPDLVNYGNVDDDMWRLRYRPTVDPAAPATSHDHIQLPYAFRSVHGMTDESIASAARSAARDICSACHEATPRCDDANGSFSWGLYGQVSLRMAGGGRAMRAVAASIEDIRSAIHRCPAPDVHAARARARVPAKLVLLRTHPHTSSTNQQPKGGPCGAGFPGLTFPHRRSWLVVLPADRTLYVTASLHAIGPAPPPPSAVPCGAPALRPTFVVMPPGGLIHTRSARQPAMKQDTAPRPALGRPAPAGAHGGDLP